MFTVHYNVNVLKAYLKKILDILTEVVTRAHLSLTII